MSNVCDISFIELRAKDVVNSCDGRKLGRIIDMIFSYETGKIKGIVVPFARKNFFAKAQDIFIPWRCVRKLGEDVIIVDLDNRAPVYRDGDCSECPPPCPPVCDCPPEKPCPPPDACGCDEGGMPNCDRRCEKCMLFDCAYRWKWGKC